MIICLLFLRLNNKLLFLLLNNKAQLVTNSIALCERSGFSEAGKSVLQDIKVSDLSASDKHKSKLTYLDQGLDMRKFGVKFGLGLFTFALFLYLGFRENFDEQRPTIPMSTQELDVSETYLFTPAPDEQEIHREFIRELEGRQEFNDLSLGGLRSYEQADAFIAKIRKLGEDRDRNG